MLGRSPAFCFGSAKNDTRCDLIQFVSSLGWAPRDGDGPRDVLIGFGVNDCGNAQNCVKVCPKEIPLTESIGAMGRSTTIHSIASFFTGKK